MDLVRRTRAAGWPVKVAVSPRPATSAPCHGVRQGYADFLGAEFGARWLVVMPQGFGGQRLGENFERAFDGLSPSTSGGDALAAQPLTAVARLAALNRHAVPLPKIDRSAAARTEIDRRSSPGARLSGAPAAVPGSGCVGSGGGDGGQSPLPFLGPVVIVPLVLLRLYVSDRRRPPQP